MTMSICIEKEMFSLGLLVATMMWFWIDIFSKIKIFKKETI